MRFRAMFLRTNRRPRADVPALLALASIVLTMTACAPETAPTGDNSAVADRSGAGRPNEALDAAPSGPGRTAAPATPVITPAAPAPGESLALGMPVALRGRWRVDDLGREPTGDDCNQTSTDNRNFGKVLTIRDNGYSLFEEGGRLIRVYARSDQTIDARFDTTYADTPTEARFAFVLRPGGRLGVTDKGGGGQMIKAAYRRCAS